MDAKTFITAKHESAVAELKAIEAEYKARTEAAKATIEMTKVWLSELGLTAPATVVTPAPAPEAISTPEPAPVEEREISLAEFTKSASENWVSARDLNPMSRQAAR